MLWLILFPFAQSLWNKYFNGEPIDDDKLIFHMIQVSVATLIGAIVFIIFDAAL